MLQYIYNNIFVQFLNKAAVVKRKIDIRFHSLTSDHFQKFERTTLVNNLYTIIIMKLDIIIELPVKYAYFYEPEKRGGVPLNYCTSGVISVFNRGGKNVDQPKWVT